MLKAKVFSGGDIFSIQVIDTLKLLHADIFLTPSNMTLDEVVEPYINSSAAVKKVVIIYDDGYPAGFLCMQRYLVDIDNEKVNVFRSQAGLLNQYRRCNILNLRYLRFILSEVLRSPRKSYFFALCIHPSSYRAIVRGSSSQNVWPTQENIGSNRAMKKLCAQVCHFFDLDTHYRNGVFIHNDGLGPTRGANECADNINNDAEFFLRKNRGYINGDGMAVLAKVSFSDMLRRTLNQLFCKINRKMNVKRADKGKK